MGLTSAQRYNRRMDKIFNDYKKRCEKEKKMSYKDLITDGYSKETARHIVRGKKKHKC